MQTADVRLSDAEREAVAAAILGAIDAYCVSAYDDGHRSHLGASVIGHPCERHLWYHFRWTTREPFTGRQLRLFNRGHREEARFVEWLRGIGFNVEDETEDGKQVRIAGVSGHFGGSLDGQTDIPAWLVEVCAKLAELGRFLLEFKTSGTGRSFTDLRAKGVRGAKPRHFAQMSVYGHKRGLRYALYLCINKNDDDIYVEIVELDHVLAETLEAKAHNVITAQTPPGRISESKAWFDCKWCAYNKLCHEGEPAERNCRSCAHAKAIDGGEWSCALAPEGQNVIPREFIAQGCGNWQDITAQ